MQAEGVRRILALVHGLPLEAATWRQERAAQPQWTTEHELLATIAEATDAGHRFVATLLGGKLKGKPLEIQHPDRKPRTSTGGGETVGMKGLQAEARKGG